MKILYVFTSGRKVRLHDSQSGKETPLEFLFGLPYLQRKGFKVDIIELTDLHPNTESHEYKSLYKKNIRINKRTLLTSSSHFFIGITEQFNYYDLIIAGNEYIAFGLAYYKQKGALRPPMVFFVMGMLSKVEKLEKISHGIDSIFNINYRTALKYYRELVKNSKQVIFLGKGEYNYALKLFGDYNSRLHFLPYSIDTGFWRPSYENSDKSYILFIGNDANRDFDLLIRIAKVLKDQKFIFITLRIRNADLPENVELIEGDWKRLLLDDLEIREYYHNSRMVILPLKESLQPSGQSVCLQAMACGVPVLITKTKGLWDTMNFINNKHLVLVDSNTDGGWTKAILNTLNDIALMSNLRREGRLLVEEKNNLDMFGKKLEGILSLC